MKNIILASLQGGGSTRPNEVDGDLVYIAFLFSMPVQGNSDRHYYISKDPTSGEIKFWTREGSSYYDSIYFVTKAPSHENWIFGHWVSWQYSKNLYELVSEFNAIIKEALAQIDAMPKTIEVK